MKDYCMNDLQGKTVLVTGGGSGIGLACARAFLGRGAKVALLGRQEERLRIAARELNSGDRLICCPADVTQPNQVSTAVLQVADQLGPIGILVNNAGVNIKERTMRELNPQRWRRLVDANLDGAFYVTHAVLPGMLNRQDGLIIFISSIAGKRANPLGGAAYAAAKFGMRALGLCLAAEEKDSGLRVSVIYPGEVDTPILVHRPQPITPQHRAQILQADDVAAAVLFVATLPPRASVPELVIKPTTQVYA
jgi:NADP-dependent 3-hydroxy acid dehydrogenase YdfG